MSFPLLYIPAAVAVTTAVSPLADILDSVSSTPTFAGSVVRRLKSTYSGPLFRGYRESDNATQDFYPGDDGLLDTTALLTWAGTSSVWVQRVYDQAGSARMLVSGDPENQGGRIVVTGTPATLYTVNGYPSIQFDEGWAPSNHWMDMDAPISALISLSQYTMLSVCRLTAGDSAGNTIDGFAIQADVEGGPGVHAWNRSGTRQIECQQWDGSTKAAGAAISSYPISCVAGSRFGSGSLRAFRDGVSNGAVASGNITGFGTASNWARIARGRNSGVDTQLRGSIQECYWFNVALSNADLNTLGASCATIAGSTWTTVAW